MWRRIQQSKIHKTTAVLCNASCTIEGIQEGLIVVPVYDDRDFYSGVWYISQLESSCSFAKPLVALQTNKAKKSHDMQEPHWIEISP